MRAFQLAMQLTKYAGSSSDPQPSDEELYEMEDGATEVDVTPFIREETEERYREWAIERDRALAARQMLAEVEPSRHDNDDVWREAIDEFHDKYRAHRQACATRLPLSLRLFGRREEVTEERYHQLLLSPNPVEAVAAAFGMQREEVEATKLPPEREYLEWTFLARYVSRYATVSRGESSAQACMQVTVHLVDALINGTYRRSFSKTKVRRGGSSSQH